MKPGVDAPYVNGDMNCVVAKRAADVSLDM
jgi:hypothetical protein